MSELNLLPNHIKQRKMRRLTVIQGLITVVLVASILGSAAYFPYARLKNLQAEESKLKESLAREREVKPENERLKREVSLLKGFIDMVDNIKDHKQYIQPIFKGLEKHLPTDVEVTNITFANGTISVSASAKAYNSIYELLANLQESAEYKDSTITNINRVEDGAGWTFFLNIINIRGQQNE